MVIRIAATPHVETVVLLSQQKLSDRIEVDLDLDKLDATSAETKATYVEIKDYVLKEHGLKVLRSLPMVDVVYDEKEGYELYYNELI